MLNHNYRENLGEALPLRPPADRRSYTTSWDATRVDDLDKGCVPFNDTFPAPSQTTITVGQVGDMLLVTYPGEPGTRLAEAIFEGVRERHGAEQNFFFIGYGQDYIGYSILEEDWWFGGYEASGALWGPKQGAYLVDRALEAMDDFLLQRCPSTQPDPLVPFPYTIDAPYVAEGAIDGNQIGVDVLATYGVSDAVEVTVYGQDPWLGPPVWWLEDSQGEPLRRANGVRVDSDDYNFDVLLSTEPSYSDQPRGDRRFVWRARIPVRQAVVGSLEIPSGTWTLVAQVPQPLGEAVEVRSSAFEVLSE